MSASAKHAGIPMVYFVVWGALLVLTGVTVAVGGLHLGRLAWIVAIAIATVKATLVVLFFMHLWDHHGMPRVVLLVSVFFVLLLVVFTFSEVATRFPPTNPTFGHPISKGATGEGH